MELQTRQIVEVSKLPNGKYVICLISIAPRDMIYYHKQMEPHKSFRWLSDIDWSAFDNVIESLALEDSVDNLKKSVELNSTIQLQIEAITTGLNQLCQFVSGPQDLKAKNVAMALKCELKYNEQHKENGVSEKTNGAKKTTILKNELVVPAFENSDAANDLKPTKGKSCKTPTTCKLDDDLDAQIQSFHIGHQEQQQQKQQNLGVLTPVSSSATLNMSQEDTDTADTAGNGGTPTTSTTTTTTTTTKAKSMKRETTKGQRNAAKRSKSNAVEEPNSTPTSPLGLATRQRRTISKPRRFNEFVMLPKQQHQSPKTATTDEDRDDDDDDDDDDDEDDEVDFAALEEPKTPKNSRKLPMNSKTVETKPKNATSTPSTLQKRSATPKSCDRLILQQQKQRKLEMLTKKDAQKNMQVLMEELVPTSPPKVEFLSLTDMTFTQVMNTLNEIKPRLDEIFKDVSHKDYVKSHGGVDHFLVINLIPAKIKSEMMKKLGELYEKDETPKFGSHFINVLLPEWILSLFIKRYKMTREDAIKHLRAQNSEHIKFN